MEMSYSKRVMHEAKRVEFTNDFTLITKPRDFEDKDLMAVLKYIGDCKQLDDWKFDYASMDLWRLTATPSSEVQYATYFINKLIDHLYITFLENPSAVPGIQGFLKKEGCKGAESGHRYMTDPPYTCIYCGAMAEREDALIARDEARSERDQAVESRAFVNGQLARVTRGLDALKKVSIDRLCKEISTVTGVEDLIRERDELRRDLANVKLNARTAATIANDHLRSAECERDQARSDLNTVKNTVKYRGKNE